MAEGMGMSTEYAYEVAGFDKIEVDITSLSDYAKALRDEVEKNLKPVWDRIGSTLLNDEPRFGTDAELELDEKRTTYDQYLQQARKFLFDVIDGTYQLADSAERIAAAYERADQFASLKAEDVGRILPEIEPAPPTRAENRGL